MSHSFPQSVQLVTGPGGFPRFEIRSPLAEADICLHGAHVIYYARTGEAPLLFLSKNSYYEPGRPIRGGVPIVFPWFGNREEGGPAHGFARLKTWGVESVLEEPDGTVVIVFRLEPDEESIRLWRDGWVLRHRVTIGRTLGMALEITNTGSTPFECEEALHTYFAVKDVRMIEVIGLENANYITAIEDAPRKQQPDQPIRFERETDRAYVGIEANPEIIDPETGWTITVKKTGARSVVVWNPWVEKARAMADFDDQEWPFMVCVETGNVKDDRLTIAPGQTHVSKTELISRAYPEGGNR